ncbi:MAG: hypothetical protein R2809_10800 [Flavobacteriales bacterium]
MEAPNGKNLDQFLVKRLHKEQVELVAQHIRGNKKSMEKMVDFATQYEGTVGMKASWILGAASVQEFGSVNAFIPTIIDRLAHVQTAGIKRELLKTILHSHFTESENLGKLVDLLFYYMRSNSEDISVSYNGIKVMQKVIKVFPELGDEFKDTLQHQMPYKSPTWQKLAKSTIAKL